LPESASQRLQPIGIGAEPDAAAFAHFIDFVIDSPSTMRDLSVEPGAFLATAATRQDPAWREKLQPKAHVAVVREVPKAATVSEPTLGAQRADRGVSPKLRHAAAEELDHMRRHDRSSYEAVKKAYLDSVDEDFRKTIRDVQRRLGQEQFELHLRSQLIIYMAQNPSAWRSKGVGAVNSGLSMFGDLSGSYV
jgi:hypothetical protein